jgi:hypothetical protein
MRRRLEQALPGETLELPYVASRDFGDAEIAQLAEQITVTLERA